MGIFDKLQGEADKLVDKHGDKIEHGIDKAAHLVDERTKGKYADQIDKGARAAKSGIHKLGGTHGDQGPAR
jgi:hypothetical protein